MFDLKRPCNNCPFRKGVGETFQLNRERLTEIFDAVAFQCHKTVNYGEGDRAGDHPQQCAGLIALLHKEGRANRITRTAVGLINFNPGSIEASDVYDSIDEALAAHTLNPSASPS